MSMLMLEVDVCSRDNQVIVFLTKVAEIQMLIFSAA